MLKIITALTVFATGYTAQAQVSENRNVAPFTKIEVTDGIELTVKQNSTTSFKAESENPGELKNVITEITGNTLKIRKSKNTDSVVKVYISAPTITSIQAESKSKVNIPNCLHAVAFSLNLSGYSEFAGNINAVKLTIHAKSGAMFKGCVDVGELSGDFSDKSKVILTGKSNTTVIGTENGVLCHAANFESDNLKINAGAFCEVIGRAKVNINIAMAETAKVTYYGNPLKVQVPENAVITNKKGLDRLLTSN